MMSPTMRQNVGKKSTALIFCGMLFAVSILAFYLQQKGQAQQANAELAQMQRNAQRIAMLRHPLPPPPPEGASLQTLLKTSAAKLGLRLGTVRSDKNNLDVVLPPQPVKPLLLWLENLQQEYGMGVNSIELSLHGDEVRVQALSLQVISVH
ncbi:type II secretion system protein GspM [Serratia quinivorans]|uniref:type II secretion system protein GspM n=1 Tax=Serratia quinivorans TaxID=137545 RepID=UPI001C47D6D2|nr:type II secretion system protein GspM [Serratia quinivorans]MBV6691948.1 type II secretion system protein M [Serratia quinivorans]